MITNLKLANRGHIIIDWRSWGHDTGRNVGTPVIGLARGTTSGPRGMHEDGARTNPPSRLLSSSPPAQFVVTASNLMAFILYLPHWRHSLKSDPRAYRSLALEIIVLCRFFVQAHEQNSNYSVRLKKCCLFTLSLLCHIPMTYNLKKGANRCRRCIKVRG